jgi:hypothetical protein
LTTARRIADQAKAAVSLLATTLPLVERAYAVLPVSHASGKTLAAAMVATLLCVIAGYATARHSYRGLDVGWMALVLFFLVVVALFGFMDLIPRGDRALYILCFALFGLSAASFLSIRHEDSEAKPAPTTSW